MGQICQRVIGSINNSSSNDISFARAGEVDSFECKYVNHYDSGHAKWLHNVCEEFRQGTQMCSSSSSTDPGIYDLYPCASKCNEYLGSAVYQKNWCGENPIGGNLVPAWIETPVATPSELSQKYYNPRLKMITKYNNVQCFSATRLPNCTGEEMLQSLIEKGHLSIK